MDIYRPAVDVRMFVPYSVIMEAELVQSLFADLSFPSVLLVFLYFPSVHFVTAVLSGLIGCDPTIWAMLANFVFAVYYAVAVDVGYGLMQIAGTVVGCGTLIAECVHGPPVLGWELRDWELLVKGSASWLAEKGAGVKD